MSCIPDKLGRLIIRLLFGFASTQCLSNSTKISTSSETAMLSNNASFFIRIFLAQLYSSGLKVDKLTGKLMKEHPETKSLHESPRNG